MSYPYFNLVKYFINDLQIEIDQINLYKKNAIFFLFDNITKIYCIDKNYNLITQVLQFLIDKNINIKQIDYKGNTLFLYLSKIWNLSLLKMLYNSGIDINKCNKLSDSDESLNDYLLSKKPKLYLADFLGRTPVFYLFVKMNDEFNSNLLDPISSLSKLLEY